MLDLAVVVGEKVVVGVVVGVAVGAVVGVSEVWVKRLRHGRVNW